MSRRGSLTQLVDAWRAVRYCPHKPHPKQQQFLACTTLEALYGGAAGGGKSESLLMAALQYVDIPGYSALLLRRSYTDLALPGAVMARSHEWLADTAAEWSERDKTWTFPSGATLTFGYLAGPRDRYRYQSAEFQYVGFDELTQFSETDYQYLFSRLRRHATAKVPLRMRAATNPGGVGHDWVKARFLDTLSPDRLFVPAQLEDNPSVDRTAYDTALQRLDPVTRDQLRHGLWLQDNDGLLYPCNWQHAIVDTLEPVAAPWRHILGIDYGLRDSTAIVAVAFSESSPRIYVRAAHKATGLTPSDAAELTRAWERTYDPDRIVGDTGGLGAGYAEEARRRFALPIVAATKRDKRGYQSLMAGDLCDGRMHFLRSGTEPLITELRSLYWEDQRRLREHPSCENHCADALLYAWREARHWEYLPAAPSAEHPYVPDELERSEMEHARRAPHQRYLQAMYRASDRRTTWLQ